MDLSLQTQSQVYLGMFEKEVHPWLYRFSKGVATAIDIGAAHGEYTVYFLARTVASRVYAFEPNLECRAFLHQNLRLNGLDGANRLQVSKKLVGVSDSEEEMRLDSLTEFVCTPVFIKMDVDGGEESVLKGSQKLNALPGTRWLIETHSRELEAACVGILASVGFQTRIIPNAWWRFFLPELRPEHNRWLAAWKSDGECPCGSVTE
jgi:hypothetical protein